MTISVLFLLTPRAFVWCPHRYTSVFVVILCLYRVAFADLITTMFYAMDTRKRSVLWVQLASIAVASLCGAGTVGRFFRAMVSAASHPLQRVLADSCTPTPWALLRPCRNPRITLWAPWWYDACPLLCVCVCT